jgi:hypothetical protein
MSSIVFFSAMMKTVYAILMQTGDYLHSCRRYDVSVKKQNFWDMQVKPHNTVVNVLFLVCVKYGFIIK